MAGKTYKQRLADKARLAIELQRKFEAEMPLPDLESPAERDVFGMEMRAEFLAGVMERDFPEVSRLLRAVRCGGD